MSGWFVERKEIDKKTTQYLVIRHKMTPLNKIVFNVFAEIFGDLFLATRDHFGGGVSTELKLDDEDRLAN